MTGQNNKWIGIIIIVVIVVGGIFLIINSNNSKKLYENNLVIPRTAGGVIVDMADNKAIVIFDLNDPIQKELLGELDFVCRRAGLENCQTLSLD